VWRGSSADAGRSRIDARAHCDANARCDADASPHPDVGADGDAHANGGTAFVAHGVDREIQAEPLTNPPVVISRYRYQGQAVYFAPQHYCDIFSHFYDDEGNVIAHPDGGITRQGDGRARDFASSAEFQYVV
jgi:hypothetical protein